MSTTVNVTWDQDMAFKADVNGFSVPMDASAEVGGTDQGPRPKQLTLAALGGCTGIDVVSILNKMRISLDSFNIQIHAEQADDHPKIYKKIHIVFQFKGKDLPLDKLEKAVTLSQEKYCSVSAMLRQAAELTHEIVIL